MLVPPRQYRLDLDEQLSVAQSAELIEQAWKKSSIVIIQSETGSGKSTQVPKIALKLFGGRDQRPIVMTQPRRLATTMIAQRINEELEGQPQEFVGWQIKGHKHLDPSQVLHVMTEGVLLQHLQHDLLLKKYSCVILDEIHERTISGDLICGFLKDALRQRPDLKIALLSATFGEQKWAEYFPSAEKISIGGRSFPIEDYYYPDHPSTSLDERVLWALDHQNLPQEGNILLFCATEGQIHELSATISRLRPRFECSPLYSRMNPLMQKKAIYERISGKQKIILSTNIAETSLTLPNISTVIDLGQEKIMMYHPALKVLSYPIVPISQASILQRRGRCGRTQAGRCFHLYTEEDMRNRPLERIVEIQRSSLASVYLKIVSIYHKNFHRFEFLSPPQESQKKEALWTLQMLNLIDEEYKMTPLGKDVINDTLDPRFSVIMRAAQKRKMVPCISVIVGFLSSQDPRLRPFEKRSEADQKHLQDQDLSSDFIAILNLWNRIQKHRSELSRKKFELYCHQNFLHTLYVQQWEDSVRDLNKRFSASDQESLSLIDLPPSGLLHELILAGFYDRVFTKVDQRTYKGPHNTIALSPLKQQGEISPPLWLLAITTLSQPKGMMLRYVGAIEPHLLMSLGAKYLVFQKSQWQYCPEKGAAYYQERILLWGLTIAGPKRKWAQPSDIEGRKIAIEGLVQQAYEDNFVSFPFWSRSYSQAQTISYASHQPQVLKTLSELIEFAQKTWPLSIYNRESLLSHSLNPVSFRDFLSYDLGLSPQDFPQHIEVDNEKVEIIYPQPHHPLLGYQLSVSERLYQRYHPLAWIALIPYYRKCILKQCLNSLGKKEKALIEHLDEFVDLLSADYRWPEYLWGFLNRSLKDYYEIVLSIEQWSIKKIQKQYLPSLWIEHPDSSLCLIEPTDLETEPQPRERNNTQNWHDDLLSAYHSGLLKSFDPDLKQEIFYPSSQKMTWYGELIQYYAQLFIADKRVLSLLPTLATRDEKVELFSILWGSSLDLPSLPFKSEKEMHASVDALFQSALIRDRSFNHDLLSHLRSCKKLQSQSLPSWAREGIFALEQRKFFRHLPTVWLKQTSSWLMFAHLLPERIRNKPQLASTFESQSSELMKEILKISDIRLCPYSPFWALWWEWVGNTFFQPHRTLIPVSPKRLVLWAKTSQMGQIKPSK